MTNINITNFRKKLFEYVNQAIEFNDIISVSTKEGNVVVMNEEDYRGLMETVYLTSMPGMTESIKNASKEPLEEGVDAKELDW